MASNSVVNVFPQPYGNTQYCFSNLAISFAAGAPAVYFPFIASMEYSDTCEVEEGRGVSPYAIGRTLGTYKASGSIEIFKAYTQQFQDMIAANSPDGNSLCDATFDVTCQYQLRAPQGQPQPPIVTDVVKGCCLTGQAISLSNGSAVITTKFNLYVALISWNGRYALSGLPQ